MSGQKAEKLNLLQERLEEGLLAPTWWLEEQGYSRQLLSKYAGRWLDTPARGVYRRAGPPLKWQHVVASLQLVARTDLHVGGKTALVQRGLGHYVQMHGAPTVLLYGSDALPAWVGKLGLRERFVTRSDRIFSDLRLRRPSRDVLVDAAGKRVGPDALADFGLQEMPWGAWDWPLLYSTEERAIFELLQDVPGRESVYEADALMQGLVGLRPKRVTDLLRVCRSVKVKRLFLALAERHEHPWLAHVDLSDVDLGKGKRALVRGGKLHSRYLITLPEDLDVQLR